MEEIDASISLSITIKEPSFYSEIIFKEDFVEKEKLERVYSRQYKFDMT